MWLFSSTGFLSIVADRDNPDRLLVRARVAGHIESVFPDAKVVTDQTADYRFRSRLPRKQVANAIAASVRAIDYDNFKMSITDHRLHTAAIDVWILMRRLQNKILMSKYYN
jgi:hypothetical protein